MLSDYWSLRTFGNLMGTSRLHSSNIMAINKQKAVDLRLSGLTHQQIADQLGCSLDWCKQNLKGIGKQTKHSLLIDQVRQIGRTVKGITNLDVFMLIKNAYPQLPAKDLTELISDIKKAARRGCKDVTIRPDWMPPETSKRSLETMISMGQEVYEFKQSLAEKYREEFNLDADYQSGIVYELSKLSAGKNNKLMPMGLVRYGTYLESIADTLDERHKQIASYENEGCINAPIDSCKFINAYQRDSPQAFILEEEELPY